MGSSSHSKLTKPIRGLKGNAPPGVGEPTLGGIGFTEQACASVRVCGVQLVRCLQLVRCRVRARVRARVRVPCGSAGACAWRVCVRVSECACACASASAACASAGQFGRGERDGLKFLLHFCPCFFGFLLYLLNPTGELPSGSIQTTLRS